MQGFAADPVYVKGKVFAYVGFPQNLKDLKVLRPRFEKLRFLFGQFRSVPWKSES